MSRNVLTRKNLSDQFAPIVQQEIKNHNDAVLAVNVAVNKANEKIDANQRLVESNFSTIDSRLTKIEDSMQRIRNAFGEKVEKISTRTNDFESNLNRQESDISDLREDLSEIHITITNFEKKYGTHFTSDQLRHDIQIKENELIKRTIEYQKLELKKDISDLRKEILSLPSEAKQVKEEIDKKLEVDRVDFKGLMRELEVFKRRMFVIEKNIENIYTELEKKQEKPK